MIRAPLLLWTAEMATDKHGTAQISPLWLHYQTSSILIVSPRAYAKAAAVQD